jgi:hypothetical protein
MFTTRTITVSNSNITVTASTAVGLNYIFTLADCDDYTNYTQLFDQYRIDAVRFILRPTANAVGLVSPATVNVVPLYIAIDYDDANTPTSAAQIRAYDNCCILPPGESICRTFVPRMALDAYQGAFTGFANVAPQWIDANSSGVQHYGIKIWVPAGAASQTTLQSWIVEREYFLSFRKTHG